MHGSLLVPKLVFFVGFQPQTCQILRRPTARGNGICLNALICRSLRPAVKRFRSWSVGGFFEREDGRWEWRCWNRGFCHATNEDLKRAFGVVPKFLVCFFFTWSGMIVYSVLHHRNRKNPCEVAKITIRVLNILDQFWKMNFRRIFRKKHDWTWAMAGQWTTSWSQNSQIVFQYFFIY